jgi:hypothetical protein
MKMIDLNDTENLIGMSVYEFSYERESSGVQHISLMLSDGRVFVSDSDDPFFTQDDAFLIRTLNGGGVISMKVWVYEKFPDKAGPEATHKIWHTLDIETHEQEGSQIVSDTIGVAIKTRESGK